MDGGVTGELRPFLRLCCCLGVRATYGTRIVQPKEFHGAEQRPIEKVITD